jgi:hypothetical protein
MCGTGRDETTLDERTNDGRDSGPRYADRWFRTRHRRSEKKHAARVGRLEGRLEGGGGQAHGRTFDCSVSSRHPVDRINNGDHPLPNSLIRPVLKHTRTGQKKALQKVLGKKTATGPRPRSVGSSHLRRPLT